MPCRKGWRTEKNGGQTLHLCESIDDVRPKLRKLTTFWKKVLRLMDWDIYLQEAVTGLPDNGCQAQVRYDLCRKTAVVSLNDPKELTEFERALYDEEADLVHELLHLVLAPLWMFKEKTEEQEFAEEQIVNLLSSALLKLKNGTYGTR